MPIFISFALRCQIKYCQSSTIWERSLGSDLEISQNDFSSSLALVANGDRRSGQSKYQCWSMGTRDDKRMFSAGREEKRLLAVTPHTSPVICPLHIVPQGCSVSLGDRPLRLALVVFLPSHPISDYIAPAGCLVWHQDIGIETLYCLL
jgi:hypothetical protein